MVSELGLSALMTVLSTRPTGKAEDYFLLLSLS